MQWKIKVGVEGCQRTTGQVYETALKARLTHRNGFVNN
jgi:hypothetical protein